MSQTGEQPPPLLNTTEDDDDEDIFLSPAVVGGKNDDLFEFLEFDEYRNVIFLQTHTPLGQKTTPLNNDSSDIFLDGLLVF